MCLGDELLFFLVQEVSCTGTESFRAGDVRKGLSIGDDFIVPGIKAFTRCEFQGDDRVLEQVRAQWCKCLDQRSLIEGKRGGGGGGGDS